MRTEQQWARRVSLGKGGMSHAIIKALTSPCRYASSRTTPRPARGNGTTHVVLDPMEFIARLVAPEVPLAQRARSVPRPRAHLTRYHGVFAPNFKHRRRIVPKPAHQTAREPHASRPAPMSWMQRLKHVFHIDGVCGGTLRVIACIETPDVIERILTHLAARNTGCIDYPRAPPLHAPEAQPPASPSPTPS